jgi:glutamine synthetase
LAEGERVDGSSLFNGMVDAALSDLYIVPVFRTAFLNPFDDGSLDFICRYLTPDGMLAPFAPDNILAAAEAHFPGENWSGPSKCFLFNRLTARPRGGLRWFSAIRPGFELNLY